MVRFLVRFCISFFYHVWHFLGINLWILVRPNSIPSKTVTPAKSLKRSLSGVETAPIDIIYPRELKLSRSSSIIITDEALELEIKKCKSTKEYYNSPSAISAHLSKTPSPVNSDGYAPTSPESPQRDQNSGNTSPLISPFKKEKFEHQVVSSTSKSDTPKDKGSGKKNKAKNKNKGSPEKGKESSAKKMAQKDIATVEEKMSAMKISNKTESAQKVSAPVKPENPKTETKEDDPKSRREIHRKNSGRDSANHSPSDVMLASPSLSSMSDNHSEGSSDSGKGGSDVATPPPSRTPQLENAQTSYEFVIPQNLVGKLIGRQGFFVQSIKERCNAQVYIRRHPSNNRLKLCSIEGTQAEIDKALKMIREKFPLKKYSDITLEQVHLTPLVHTVPLIPDSLYLKLVDGINNDTILSCMVAPDHLFMQQPTHPSFPSLSLLKNCMNQCYADTNSPLLPSPIPENTVCVAYSIDSWYRAIVLSTDEETETSYVKFLDYGGYAYVENDKLRQIRQDFIMLPFQAAECFLANVKSKNEDGSWPEGAYNLIAELTKGSIIYTQVADYTPDGVPVVLCFIITSPTDYIFLNQKLVDEGYADWVPFEDTPTTSTQTQQSEEPASTMVA
ncbi:A-kinase anchor protein 1, mitochondrial isoform X2 [Anthonomus grandis grandis]|uniref:A-kinase anchor protein 1, mitochondrial isoform X2 n=1 Tax=Anthonomus grandis grandis TaxID=2921223 RepID=UPI0021667AC4|nr:A-kinase anchor protein 1, mitochondrial isoform X2 [Anthonomus grandis grandis]